MSSRIDATSLVVSVVAVILLLISGILIVQQGIPALEGVAIPTTYSTPNNHPATHVAVIQTPLPTPNRSVTTNIPQNATATSTVDFPIVATTIPIACPKPISGDDRIVFDASNGALGDASSYTFHIDLTFDVNIPNAGQGSLQFVADGFSQTLTDQSIQLQAETHWTLIAQQAGQPDINETFDVPFRFDMKNIYFRIIVPSRSVNTPWLATDITTLLNNATGGTFQNILPNSPDSGDPSSLLTGLDMDALAENPGAFTLLNFGDFICTQRFTNESGKAHYASRVDIVSFLQSSDFAGTIDSVFAAMNMGETGTGAQLVASMPILLSQFVSELQINIDSYANTVDRQLSRVTIDIDSGFNLPLENNVILPLEFDITGEISYSDYSKSQTLDIPTNPVIIKDFNEINAYLQTGS